MDINQTDVYHYGNRTHDTLFRDITVEQLA